MIEKTTIDLSEERRVLSYMITSTLFLTKLQGIAQPKLFQSSHGRRIAKWIWEFFEHTQEAPGRAIEEIYHKKKKDIKNEDELEIVTEFLSRLSKEWEKAQVQNVNYTVKNAVDFFKIRSLDVLKSEIEKTIDTGNPALGERLISEYRKIERVAGKGVDLLKDRSAFIEALSHENEYLFSYPGELGKAIGDFMRGDFFAIMGAMKKGKSHYLWYTAYRAMMMGWKVLFVSLEMSEEQMLRRMWQGMVGQPLEDGVVKKPYFRSKKGDIYEVAFNEDFVKGIDLSEIEKKQKSYTRATRTGDMRLVTYPSYGASTEDIETELINLEYYEGFVPDVVVIDYADILKPISDRQEYRHQLDVIWKTLRGLAQKRNILVATASQGGGKAGMVRDINAGDVAEDSRKLAHVTKMIHINQNDKEYEDGIIRAKTSVQREGRRYIGEVVILQCLDIGRPFMDSKIKRNVDMQKYEEKPQNKK